MGSQDQGNPAERKPAESEAPETPTRRLKVAELRAAAQRARTEIEAPQKPEAAAPQGNSDQGAAGAETPSKPAEPSGDKPPAETPAPDKGAEKPTEATPAKEPEKVVEDPKAGPDNPFWKTQLGRYIREKEASTDATIAELRATIKLLQSEKPPKETEEDELEKEMGLVDGTGKTGGKPDAEKKGAESPEAVQAKYAQAYLANNAKEEFRKDPQFSEIQALMFNREDKEGTFNRAHTGVPDADYLLNFNNAKYFLLEQKLSALGTSTEQKPGAGNLKQETPTAPLGVGGDVKVKEGGAPKKTALNLDESAQRYLSHVRRKGRDEEKLIQKAFAVDLEGAARSAGR